MKQHNYIDAWRQGQSVNLFLLPDIEYDSCSNHFFVEALGGTWWHFLPVQGDEEDVEDDGHLAHEGQIVEVAEVGVHARNYSFVMKGQSLLEVLNYAKKTVMATTMQPC